MKPGDIEYKGKDITSVVSIGDSPRDAVIRVEEFLRGYFGDDSLFVGNESATVEVGTVGGNTLYKVVGW